MKLKDLKIAYNVLCDLDYPVPNELLVHMAQRIREAETKSTERKILRMTEEQLIRRQSQPKRLLRIYTADGRMIQRKLAEDTFRDAMMEIGPERVSAMDLRLGRRAVLLYDQTQTRRRIHGYRFLMPGFFLLRGTTAAEKARILRRIDEALHLDWEVELL